MLEMSAKSSDPLYQTIEVEESVDNEVVSEPVDMAHDEIEDGNKNDEQIYCNDQGRVTRVPRVLGYIRDKSCTRFLSTSPVLL